MQIRLVKPPARRALFSLRALLYGPPSHSAAPGSLSCIVDFFIIWLFLAVLYRCFIRGTLLFFLLCASLALRLDRIQEGSAGRGRPRGRFEPYLAFLFASCRRRPPDRREFLEVLCACA